MGGELQQRPKSPATGEPAQEEVLQHYDAARNVEGPRANDPLEGSHPESYISRPVTPKSEESVASNQFQQENDANTSEHQEVAEFSHESHR